MISKLSTLAAVATLLESSTVLAKDGVTTVHICPHSHDDVGWLKTVDEYFYGDKTDVQRTNIQVELTSVMTSLLANPKRKFMEVEMKFFSKWFYLQN